MWYHGQPLHEHLTQDRMWERNYIGGETAFNWGLSAIQPGDDPTDAVSDPAHRDFIINCIRWLHCTQLAWISMYDQDDPQVIARRMRDAVTEMSHYPEFDYLIVNDDFDLALYQLKSIITANRLLQSQQQQTLAPLLQELLN